MKKLNFFCIIAVACVMTACKGEVTKWTEISVTGSDGTVYNGYQSACSHGDFDAARDYIVKMKEQNVVVQAEGKWGEEREAYSKLIQEAEEYVANEELQYLASLNEEPANNRIILILNQRPIEGLEAAEMACLGKKVAKFYLDKKIDDSLNGSPEEVINFKRYIIWCGNHNSRCSNILGIAISCGNQSLAKKILHSFRSDPELELKLCKKEEKGESDYYDVYAHYTNTSKEAAQKKYDEAVKSGAFN